ncbi:MAG: sensor histidine kinase [Gammaproteobacteria bacterium]|nr:sensor histidine kinase [Gammaproteobacteria bacterium]
MKFVTGIFDHRAVKATALALAIMVASFIAGYAWLNLSMLQLHDREMFGGILREASIRDHFDRTAGRDEFLRSLSFQRDPTVTRQAEAPPSGLLQASRYRAIFAPDGKTIIGDPTKIPGIRSILESPGQQLRFPLESGVTVYVVSMRLSDGSVMVISQEDLSRHEIARGLGRAALLGILMVLLVGVITIMALNRFVLDHVRNLSDTAKQILRGQMTARVPTLPQRLDAMGTLTATFNEMLDQNEALVSGMRTVTESLAHDLRAPLMRARRSIEAARNTEDATARANLHDEADAEVERALQTFNSLVDLARAEAGLSRDAMESFDLGVLATDLTELFEPLAEERGQRIECSVSTVTVIGHEQILKQAIGNLIENAIKYSPSGSELKVAVRDQSVDAGPEIIVQDRGPGIPQNAREQAVRPFVRLENPSRQPGSGMGLAIAAAVARLHHGRLVLESADPGLRVRLQFGRLKPA